MIRQGRSEIPSNNTPRILLPTDWGGLAPERSFSLMEEKGGRGQGGVLGFSASSSEEKKKSKIFGWYPLR